jgi:hypothetical protein
MSAREPEPHVELLLWEGCPSHERALAELRATLAELGLAELPIHLRRVETQEQALALRFPGSPTIRVDGVDPVPPPDGEPFGLACRLYRLRDGRVSPTPGREALRAGVGRLLEAHGKE